MSQQALPISRAVLFSDFVSKPTSAPSPRKAGKESKAASSKPPVAESVLERQGPGIKRAADDDAVPVDMEGDKPRKW